jgi:hypothetical protein
MRLKPTDTAPVWATVSTGRLVSEITYETTPRTAFAFRRAGRMQMEGHTAPSATKRKLLVCADVAALPLTRPSDRSALRLLVSDKPGHAGGEPRGSGIAPVAESEADYNAKPGAAIPMHGESWTGPIALPVAPVRSDPGRGRADELHRHRREGYDPAR